MTANCSTFEIGWSAWGEYSAGCQAWGHLLVSPLKRQRIFLGTRVQEETGHMFDNPPMYGIYSESLCYIVVHVKVHQMGQAYLLSVCVKADVFGLQAPLFSEGSMT